MSEAAETLVRPPCADRDPTDADSAAEYARRPAGSWFDDFEDESESARAPAAIAVVDDDVGLAGVRAFRGDELGSKAQRAGW